MTLSVVVLDHRSADDTVACVAALRAGAWVPDRIDVLTTGARSEADALGARLDGIAVHALGANLGYAGGNNIGIARALEAGSDLVLLLNPDARVAHDAVERLVRTAGEVPTAGALGPRVLLEGTAEDGRIASDGGSVDRDRWGAASHLGAGERCSGRPAAGVHDVDYVTGSALLLRAAAVRDVGLLPEEWFLYFEETDYCLALQRAGWRTVVDTRATVLHLRRSTGSIPSPDYLYYMTRNRLRFGVLRFGGTLEAVLADFRADFLDPWRARVERADPTWLPTFDALVARAVEAAERGETGPSPVAVSETGAVTDLHRAPAGAGGPDGVEALRAEHLAELRAGAAELGALRARAEAAEAEAGSLRRELDTERRRLESLRSSRSYRLGRSLTAPLRAVRRRGDGSP